MSKSTFFAITQGLVWVLFTTKLGYHVDDWQTWLITILGSVVFAYIYHHICKDDNHD